MFFWFKKKEIVIDCFTNNIASYEIYKLDYARKFYPEWWRDLPSAVLPKNAPNKEFEFKDEVYATMKRCAGIVDYYKTGLIIPLWSDLIVEVGTVGTSYLRVLFSDISCDSSQHPTQQRGNYLPDGSYSHLKLHSPWLLKSNKSVQFTLLKPIWNFDDPTQFILPPGSLNFKYQRGTHLNIFLKHLKENQKFQFKSGQPFAHLIPQSDCKIKIKRHLVSPEEHKRIADTPFKSSFNNGYFKYVKLIKKQNE